MPQVGNCNKQLVNICKLFPLRSPELREDRFFHEATTWVEAWVNQLVTQLSWVFNCNFLGHSQRILSLQKGRLGSLAQVFLYV